MKLGLVPAFFLVLAVCSGGHVSHSAERSATENLKELQDKIDGATENSIVDFALTEPVTLESPLVVKKPLWLRGLRLQLPAKLARTSLVRIESPGVQLTDSFFRGNGDTVGQDQRSSLVEINSGGFRVERCTFENSSKNGLTIDPGDSGKPIVGGVVRDIIGSHVTRDVVSISGGPNGAIVRDVLVENVRASDSDLRGAVEASDCSEDITIRGITADRCVYGVDFQDHEAGDVNHNVLIEDVRARNCRHAVRTATEPLGHTGLTIRDVLAVDCDVPLRVSYITDVVIDGVRIVGRKRDATEPDDLKCLVQIKDCVNVSLRDISVVDAGEIPAVVRVIDTQELSVDGLRVSGATTFDNAILFAFNGANSAGLNYESNLRRIAAPNARQNVVGLAIQSKEEPNLAKSGPAASE